MKDKIKKLKKSSMNLFYFGVALLIAGLITGIIESISIYPYIASLSVDLPSINFAILSIAILASYNNIFAFYLISIVGVTMILLSFILRCAINIKLLSDRISKLEEVNQNEFIRKKTSKSK